MVGCKTDINKMQYSDCQNTDIKKYLGIYLFMKHVKYMWVETTSPKRKFFPTVFALEAR